MSAPEKSESLLIGRRAIDGLPGITIVTDYDWFPSQERWGLQLRIETGLPLSNELHTTEWYAVLSDTYPWGSLKLYPSKINGITDTYPHQSLNDEGVATLPWRNGDVCLTFPVRQLGAGSDVQEPIGADSRLLWNIQRLVEWITAAADDSLANAGDPFELPPFPGLREQERIVYAEGSETFAIWQKTLQRNGMCILAAGQAARPVQAVQRWASPGGKTILETPWGSAFEISEATSSAFWVMLDRVPVVNRWTPPTTWSELHQAVKQQGCDLTPVLTKVSGDTKGKGGVPLLLGFPVPRLIGAPAEEVVWLAIDLPKSRGDIPNGFRRNATGYWMGYMKHVMGAKPVSWAPTANWHRSRLAARGQLCDDAIALNTVILGAGALGSILADLLARGGIDNITVIDGERLEVGNLTRHNMGLQHVGERKADAVARSLANVSPHVRARSINRKLTPVDAEAVQAVISADCVFDCTGDNTTLLTLESIAGLSSGRLWISTSLGHGAESLFAFAAEPAAFTVESFLSYGSDWLDQQQERLATDGVIFESIGCWHPAFPGRNDDIHALAATLPRLLESLVAEGLKSGAFIADIDAAEDRRGVTLNRLESRSEVR